MSGFLDAPVIESAGGYQIEHSVRLRASASAYLSRTPASAGNQRTWTWSGWVKLGALGVINGLFSANPTSGGTFCYFDTDGTIHLTVNTGAVEAFVSSARFRDPSAWYHVVVVCDTTQATISNRISVWVNNQQIAPQSTANFPSQNLLTAINSANLHRLGSWNDTTPNYFYSDSYRADHYLIDGQSLDASYFGQFDANGVWVPKAYTGTYGNNGFYLKFNDGSNLTNLCLDRSGNGNNWTASNISLTAGATYDSMIDVPLGGGGNERGNYATLNPLEGRSNKLAPLEANLLCYAFAGSNAYFGNRGSIGVTSGKWYWECSIGAKDTNAGQWMGVGIVSEATNWPAGFGLGSLSGGFEYLNDGSKWGNGTNTPGFGGVYVQNDVIGVALDCDSQTLAFYKNGVLQGTAFTSIGAGPFFPAIEIYRSASFSQGIYANFGQRPFAHTPPAGFKALHTGNLTSDTVTVSGAFTGNVSADGPAIWMNGAPETLTINGNAVTWGTHADKTAGGFKLRTSSASYNASGTNTWTATVLTPASKSAFRRQLARTNP